MINLTNLKIACWLCEIIMKKMCSLFHFSFIFFSFFYAPLLLPIQSNQLQYKPTIIIIFIPFSISQQHENLLKYFNLL